MEIKYLRNRETGVVFTATPQLIAERDGLGLVPVDSPDQPAEDSEEESLMDPNRLTLVVEAIAKLDPNDPKHFTADGIPNAKALGAIVGFAVSSEERDAAWAEYKEE